MITPPTDPQPGEIWRYKENTAVLILYEDPSPSSTKRYLCQLLAGPNRGEIGLVYRDQLREKTDEL